MKFIRNASSTRRRLSRYSALCVLLMSTSGCLTRVSVVPDEHYQASLLATCPEDLPALTGPTGHDFDLLTRTLLFLYTDCAARHNQLVNEIQQRNAINER